MKQQSNISTVTGNPFIFMCIALYFILYPTVGSITYTLIRICSNNKVILIK